MRMLVVSDVHAYSTSLGGPPPSAMRLDLEESSDLHPLSRLMDLVRDEALSADLVLCCGDLADKAHPAGVEYVWKWLNDLATELEAPLLVTPGNHDMDSRHQVEEFDARGLLLDLIPPFPTPDESLRDQFWARNFIEQTFSDTRIVNLNTAAYHGISSVPQGARMHEYEHGRVSPRTIARLEPMLSRATGRPSVLVCHHHLDPSDPMIHPDDFSQALGGGQLLAQLSNSPDQWLVVHGHRHSPFLHYAAGGSSSAVVLAAGSLCALPLESEPRKTRNQFHLVTLHSDPGQWGLTIAGEVRTWEWRSEWMPAADNSPIPHWAGFGSRDGVDTLASRIDSMVQPGVVTRWDELSDLIPTLRFIVPQDARQLETRLRELGLGVNMHQGRLSEITK